MPASTRWQCCGILATALLLGGPDAFACSIAPQGMSRAQVESYARKQFAEASAVVDVEVETPMEFGPGWTAGLMPMAILRVIRRYKGVRSPGDEIIPLVYLASCDIGLLKKGERTRILLRGGPDLFRADLLANGAPSTRESQAEFNAEIDRLIKAPRPAGFSPHPGESQPQVDTAKMQREVPPTNDTSPSKSSAPKVARIATPVTYGLGALGVLLAFLAGFLIGRRRQPRRGAA